MRRSNSSGQLEISRPDKFHASRTGGYAAVELTFDGKVAIIYGKHANGYVQVNVPGSVAQFLDQLRKKFGVALPGADLLSTNAYDVLTSDVISGVHIGRGVVGGAGGQRHSGQHHSGLEHVPSAALPPFHFIDTTITSPPRLSISPLRCALRRITTPASFCSQRSPALASPTAKPTRPCT